MQQGSVTALLHSGHLARLATQHYRNITTLPERLIDFITKNLSPAAENSPEPELEQQHILHF